MKMKVHIYIKITFLLISILFLSYSFKPSGRQTKKNSASTEKINSKDFIKKYSTRYQSCMSVSHAFSTTLSESNSISCVQSEAQIIGHSIKYLRFFKGLSGGTVDNEKELLKSEFKVDSTTYDLGIVPIFNDSISLRAPIMIEKYCRIKVTSAGLKRYIIINSNTPCYGKGCRNTVSLVIEIDSGKSKLYIISNEDAFPFDFNSLVFADINKDGNLDFYKTSMVNEQSASPESLLTVYSIVDGKIVNCKNKKGKNVFIDYECLDCSEIDNDIIRIKKISWL